MAEYRSSTSSPRGAWPAGRSMRCSCSSRPAAPCRFTVSITRTSPTTRRAGSTVWATLTRGPAPIATAALPSTGASMAFRRPSWSAGTAASLTSTLGRSRPRTSKGRSCPWSASCNGNERSNRAMARRLSTGIAAAWLILAGPPFALAQQAPRNFVALDAPRSIAAIAFEDDQGRAQSIGDFKGKVVLLNIWATWCGPCREEMPALDRLQALLGGPDFEVVALSIDRNGVDAVRKFYAEVGVRNLAIHLDPSGRSIRELSTVGVPTNGIRPRVPVSSSASCRDNTA